MAYLDQQLTYLQQLNAQALQISAQGRVFSERMGLRPNDAYARYFPNYEVAAPQYQTPNAYSLANLGYRNHEVAYACIDTWQGVFASPKLQVYDGSGEERKPVKDSDFLRCIKRNSSGLSERELLGISIIYAKIAGFCAWEVEKNNLGEWIGLWPMRPDWCSFMRGQGKMLRAIRYQPYGMQYVDIPAENVVMYAYFDPIFPGLKALSPTGVAANILTLDTKITNLITTFIEQGAFLGGVLSVAQTLQDAEAERIRQRWRQTHGGSGNAGDIAVLGEGATFSPTQMTFADMDFDRIDARNEVRICQVYHIPPIIVSARVGISASTYSNYEQARAAWIEDYVAGEWEAFAGKLTEQIILRQDPESKLEIDFDYSTVKALQEDQDKVHERARLDYQAGGIMLDEFREKIGEKPISGEEGKKFKAPPAPIAALPAEQEKKPGEKPTESTAESAQGKPSEQAEQKPPESSQEEQDEEEKHFKDFARKRIKEGKVLDIPSFEFKHLPATKSSALVDSFVGPLLIGELGKALKEIEKTKA